MPCWLTYRMYLSFSWHFFLSLPYNPCYKPKTLWWWSETLPFTAKYYLSWPFTISPLGQCEVTSEIVVNVQRSSYFDLINGTGTCAIIYAFSVPLLMRCSSTSSLKGYCVVVVKFEAPIVISVLKVAYKSGCVSNIIFVPLFKDVCKHVDSSVRFSEVFYFQWLIAHSSQFPFTTPV